MNAREKYLSGAWKVRDRVTVRFADRVCVGEITAEGYVWGTPHVTVQFDDGDVRVVPVTALED